MFHYTTKGMRGEKTRHKADIAVGDEVQSCFRARWWGTVVALDAENGWASVKMLRTVRGHPIRKGRTVRYSIGWFRKADGTPCVLS